MKKPSVILCVVLGLTVVCPIGSALSPYAADGNTLHLWSFDETHPGPAAPAAGLAAGFPLEPDTGARLESGSYPGFGGVGTTAAESASGFRGSSIPASSVTGASGAFTFEAMIRTSNIADVQHIVTMDNAEDTARRPFQFRIDGGHLRFINISGGVQQILAPIPTAGDHAFAPNAWFHVAVTYNGAENTPDNLKLYWTRVTDTEDRAHEILSTSMLSDLGGSAAVLGVGNEYRGAASENLQGSVDEVRISNIARDPADFIFPPGDSDGDGLSDLWELTYFRSGPGETDSEILAKYDGVDDPDLDSYSNAAEQEAGTHPLDAGHTPFDADRDGYADTWERNVFGTIAFGPDDDPDGDGYTTGVELAAGTDPGNPRSNPEDTDADGLSDAWEQRFFGGLAQGPLDDCDGDGANNLNEQWQGTDPADARDVPLVVRVRVSDGDPATDEQGYAGSAINSYSYARDNLITVGTQQFITYYRRHEQDPGAPDNNTVLIGRRTLGDDHWELFATDFMSADIDDTHNVISMAVDGNGILHMAWGVHGDPLRYARSDGPVTGNGPIQMVRLGGAGMTGQESGVTYPMFQTLPDGDVLFLYREGASGSGDWYLNRYDTDTDTWFPVHADGGGVQQPLMRGRGDGPDNCFYPDRLTLGPDGVLHLAGVFRYNSDSPAGEVGYQTNHRYVYLRSPDDGTTWQRSDGSRIDLPVVEAAWFQGLGAEHVPEIIEDIPEGYSLMNQSGMTTDRDGRPVIANWWADGAGDGDHTRQYFVYFHDGSDWHKRRISQRDLDNPGDKLSESQLRDSRMGRPAVITDAEDRILVIYNDNRFDGITVVFSEPRFQDPDRNQWTRINLSADDLGKWETTYDETVWKRNGVLHLFYQKLPGTGLDYRQQNSSTPVYVLQWDAHRYFRGPSHWKVESGADEVTFSAQTRTGFRYEVHTSTDLQTGFSDPPPVSLEGNGTWRTFGTWPLQDPVRFWRIDRVEEATNDL